jgi:hypothetical protein
VGRNNYDLFPLIWEVLEIYSQARLPTFPKHFPVSNIVTFNISIFLRPTFLPVTKIIRTSDVKRMQERLKAHRFGVVS